MRYFTVAACLCDNPRRILLLRRFLTALLPLVLFAFFLFPGTTWAGAGSPDIFRTLRSTLHPAIIIAAFLYLGLRVIQPLHMSRPAKAALRLCCSAGSTWLAPSFFSGIAKLSARFTLPGASFSSRCSSLLRSMPF